MKTNKKIILPVLLAMFSATLSVSVLSINAQAETTTDEAQGITMAEATVAMDYGASARISSDGYCGLRYSLGVSATDYLGLKENYGENIKFGILIAPASYETTCAEFNEETVFGANNVTPTYDWATYNEETGKWEYSGDKTRIMNLSSTELAVDENNADRYVLYGSITTINDANLATEFIGVGYVQYVESGTIQYEFLAENDNVRSIAYVAQVYQTLDTITDEDKKYVLDTYITDKADQLDTTYTVKHMLSDGNGNYTEATEYTEQVTAKINGKTVAPTSKTLTGYTFDSENTANGGEDELVYANGKTELELHYINNNKQNFTESNGVYTAIGNNSSKSAYTYTSDNYSDTVVYSVKITASNGFKEIVNYAQPHVGITLTDGSQVYDTFDNVAVLDGTYKAIQIGLSTESLISHCGTNSRMYRNLDYVDSFRDAYTTSANEYGFVSGVTEKTLTIVLYKDTLYIYVDGVFAKSVPVTAGESANTDYFNTKFAYNSTYRFGIQATNINNDTYPVQFQVMTEKYGDEALSEIQSKYIYSISCDGSTTSTFSNTTANATLVYSIDVNTVFGIPTPYCNDAGHVGIAISTAAASSEVMTIGFSQLGISSACNGGMWRRWNTSEGINTAYAFSGWANKGGTLKSGKLTIVLYNDTLYLYAGATAETFVSSHSLVDGSYENLESFASGAEWTVGVGATHIYNQNGTINGNALDCSTWGITIIERNRLYGDEALTYIRNHYSANVPVA